MTIDDTTAATGRPTSRARKATLAGGAVMALGTSLVIAGAPVASAAGPTVTNTNDSGAGSLRQAIIDANAGETITFAASLSGSTITLTSGQLQVDKPLTISGLGATALAVDANDSSRVFYLSNGSGDVTISGLTLTNGNGEGDGGAIFDGTSGTLTLTSVAVTSSDASGDGGGVAMSSGALSVTGSTISGNTSSQRGGGIFLYESGRSGSLTVNSSTISGNTAGAGGGIYLYHMYASGSIVDSTISGNVATYQGGAVFIRSLYADSTTQPTFTIAETTIAGNDGGTGQTQIRSGHLAAAVAPNGPGASVFLGADAKTIALTNSIVADSVGLDIDGRVDSALTETFSLVEQPIGSDVAVTDGGGNLATDPGLGPLAANGGPTLTHAITTASAVYNTAAPTFAPPPSLDQRGLPRVASGRLDMGAFELQPVVPVTTPPTTAPPASPAAAEAVVATPRFTG